MKPEDLKQLAEYMGYEATIGAIMEKEVVFIWHNGDETLYSPHLTNAEQCLELIVKMKIDISHLTETVVATHIDEELSATNSAERESLNEAVTIAAITAIKEEEA